MSGCRIIFLSFDARQASDIGASLMEWRDVIGSNPDILGGKPAVIGTRLSVEFLLGLFASGFTEADVLANYPQLTPNTLRAVFAFGAECARDEAANLLLAASTR